MSGHRWWCAGIVTIGVIALGVLARADRPWTDPERVTGAAPETCWNCKDMVCDYCAVITPCKWQHGYCTEVVRNVSQVCIGAQNGEWERCKTRIDDSGACVLVMSNPCTRDQPVCATTVEKCGPLGICIPEGICIP